MRKKIVIYDYKNKPTEIEITKEIKEIDVDVVSGDEIIDIYYEDGTIETYDSCPNCRIMCFDDGFYKIKKEQIDEWNNMKCVRKTYSYDRMVRFWLGE